MKEKKPKPGYKVVNTIFENFEEVPEEWELRKLGDFATLIIKRFDEKNNAPILSVTKSKGFVRSLEYFKKKIFSDDITNYKMVENGDFAYSTIHLDEGSLGLLQEFERGYISPMYNVFRLDETVDTSFIFYLLKSEAYLQKYSTMGEGTVNRRKSITFEILSQLKIPLPSLKEQQKIASILSNIDNLILKYDFILDQTKHLKKGLMQQLLTKGIGHKKFKKIKWLFGTELEIPEEWNVVKLGEITSITKLAGFEYTGYWKTDENGPIIALRGYNVQQNRLVLDDIQTISKELSDFLIRSKLYKDDIVFPFVGSIGNAARIPENDKFHINQNVAKISVQDELQSLFLVFVLLGEYIKKQIIMQNTSGTQPSVLLGNLRNFVILLPDREEQQKITSILNIVDSKINELESKKTGFEKLKKGLMQKLLTGQIRVKF